MFTQQTDNLVRGIASKYIRHFPNLRDDILQEGYLGLVQASKRYDPTTAVTFPTFAARRVKGQIQDFLRHANGLGEFRQSSDTNRPIRCKLTAPALLASPTTTNRIDARLDIDKLSQKLPKRQAQMVNALRNDNTTADIANETGVSRGSLNASTFQAIRSMRAAAGI